MMGAYRRGEDQAVGQRKGRQQTAAAHHQPGLVAVPHRRDAVHRGVAVVAHLEGVEQDADAQVEAVQHHVDEDGQHDDEGPDDGEIDVHADLLIR